MGKIKTIYEFHVIRYFRVVSYCVLLCLFSCSSNHSPKNIRLVKGFPVSSNLIGSKASVENSNFNPLLLGLKDSLLVVCDIENSPHFHVFTLPGLEYSGAFGRMGRGPFEFENPLFWGQFSNTERIKIWVYEMNRLTLSLIDVYNALQDDQYTAEKVISLPPQVDDASNFLVLNDSTLIGSGLFAQNEFVIYCREQEQLNWIPININYAEGLKTFLERNTSYSEFLKQGVFKIKPDNTRFVKSHVYFPVIDVYNASGVLEFTIQLSGKSVVPLFDEGTFDPQTKAWYENIFLTDHFIYALNRNCNIQQYANNECNNSEIHVFDWMGAPIVKYNLNEMIAPGSPFVVDEKNQKIYIVSFVDPDEFFHVFDISLTPFL